MSEAYEWLGRWEPLEAPGKHTAQVPAPFARPYQAIRYDRRPKPRKPQPTMWDRVNRAIPVEGTVMDTQPTWKKSPQVRFWLEEKKSLRQRMLEWLNR